MKGVLALEQNIILAGNSVEDGRKDYMVCTLFKNEGSRVGPGTLPLPPSNSIAAKTDAHGRCTSDLCRLHRCLHLRCLHLRACLHIMCDTGRFSRGGA